MVSKSKFVFNCHICYVNKIYEIPARAFPKKNEVPDGATNLNARCGLLHDDASDACPGFDVVNGAHIDQKVIFYFIYII